MMKKNEIQPTHEAFIKNAIENNENVIKLFLNE